MIDKLGVWVALCAVAVAMGLILAAEAPAQDFQGFGPNYLPYAHYPYLPPIPLRADKSIPYYAVHPPVYYSHIVPRPYGYSPYAYVPGYVSPQFELRGARHSYGLGPAAGQGDRPRWLQTPPKGGKQGTEKPAPQAASASRAPRALVVRNPYVSQEKDTAGETVDRYVAHEPRRIENPHF